MWKFIYRRPFGLLPRYFLKPYCVASVVLLLIFKNVWLRGEKVNHLWRFMDCPQISFLIFSEFKRINFGSPWNHQKTYRTRSKIWKRSHSEMSNIFISISFKAKIENVALFFTLFCKTLKTFAMEISVFFKVFFYATTCSLDTLSQTMSLP